MSTCPLPSFFVTVYHIAQIEVSPRKHRKIIKNYWVFYVKIVYVCYVVNNYLFSFFLILKVIKNA